MIFFQVGVSDVEKADIEGNTPLHIACKTGTITKGRVNMNLKKSKIFKILLAKQVQALEQAEFTSIYIY